ncbi:MAG: type I secretion protein TolC [Gammaproteobacteria bacterium]|jgi:outer membrane protein|nr:MAG: type I secretion protein TolC [Gammaproteobacteria bacterium]
MKQHQRKTSYAKYCRFACLPLLAALTMPVAAADLLEIYTLAEQHDPQYKQAIAANLAIHQQRPMALSRMLPTLSLSAGASRSEDDISRSSTIVGLTSSVFVSDSHNYSLNLSQPLFRWDLYLDFRQTDNIIAQSDSELLGMQQSLVVRVAEAYFGMLAAVDNLEFAQADKLALSRQLEQAKQRFEVGLTAITDVQEQQAGYDRAVAAEIGATNGVDNAREALREIIGEYIFEFKKLAQELPLLRPEPENIDDWTNTALEQSLEVVASRYAVENARDEISIQRSAHLPTLNLDGSAGYSRSDGGSFGSSKSHSNTISVQLNVPIYQGGFVTARTRESVQRLEEQMQRLEQAHRTAQSQTRQAYLGIISGISEVEAFKQALVSAETALEATEAGFEVGTRTAVDVVTAQRATSQARREYARARYDYLLDTLRLKRAAGIISSEDLARVNQWLN